jgi:hypothetical protein
MRRLAVTLTLATALAFAVAVAHAELTQRGNLRLAFSGRLTPKKLPRSVSAPVTMRVRGAIGTADGGRPPQLRRIAIAFNRYGRVSTRGLPTCDQGELEQTTSETALEHCRGALVGHGRFRAYVDLPNRAPVPVVGSSLAFNSSTGGKPELLLHIYATNPVKITFVVRFRIVRARQGDFGTVFVAHIPKIASTVGYVTDIDLTFGRNYSYRGRPRSFLSARCAAPAGFPGAVFTLARGDFTFSNGQRISTALSRNCWVR